MHDIEQINNMTLVEYHWRVHAAKIQQYHRQEELHQMAFLNQLAKSTEQKGNNKTVPVYDTFDKFFKPNETWDAIMGLDSAKGSHREASDQESLLIEANKRS